MLENRVHSNGRARGILKYNDAYLIVPARLGHDSFFHSICVFVSSLQFNFLFRSMCVCVGKIVVINLQIIIEFINHTLAHI